jgi:hypothetical protein
MSALGQKQTWRSENVMSALPPKADIVERDKDVCFVPKADIASALSNVRPRRAENSNCSYHQQPEWNYSDARYRL